MFKKFFTAAVLSASVLFGAQYAQAADYMLKLQTWYSPTTAIASQYFAEQVKKLTAGKVEIQVFTSGELVGSENILKSVKSGMIDIGHGTGHHFTENKMGTVEAGLPMSWTNPVEAKYIFDKCGLRELISSEYARNGVVYLGPAYTVPFTTLSKTPINSLEDMKKMNIRAVGATAKALTKLGINCVNLPPEDIYLALTTGQIDGVVYGSAAEYVETKFFEVAPYLNVTPILDPVVDSFFINKRLWERFPDDIKAAFSAAAQMTEFVYYMWGMDESIKAIDTVFKGKVTTFPGEDIQKLTEAAAQVWNEEAQKFPETAKGVEILKNYAKSTGRLQ